MQITNTEMHRVVHDKTNYRIASRYDGIDVVKVLNVNQLANDQLLMNATTEYGQYHNHCKIAIDTDGMIINHYCNCPFHYPNSACAHIGAVLLKFNKLQPHYFPFCYVAEDYEESESQPQNDLSIQDTIAKRREEQQKRQEELIKRFREEARIREEEILRIQHLQQIEMTHQLIQEERGNYFNHFIKRGQGEIHIFMGNARTSDYYRNYGISLDFRIGKDKMYVIKNIEKFLENVKFEKLVKYGKELEFVHRLSAFDEPSRQIIEFLNDFTLHHATYYRDYDARNPLMAGEDLGKLYALCESIPDYYHDIKICETDKKIDIEIEHADNFYTLKVLDLDSGMEKGLTPNALYQVANHTLLYTPFDEFGKMRRFLEHALKQEGIIFIKDEDMDEYYKYILYDILDYVHISGDYDAYKMLEEDQISLYGDIDEMGMISISLQCAMEDALHHGFDESFALKPLHLEIVEAYIKEYASVIDYDAHIAYMEAHVVSSYTFIREGLPFLDQYCEIFVSDALKSLGTTHHVDLHAGVSLSDGLLQVNFNSKDISRDEIYDVLKSYRKKRNYHRLKNGKLLNLEAPELEELDGLLDRLHVQGSDFKDGAIKLPAYRSFSMDAYADEAHGIEVDRDASFQELLKDFKRIDQMEVVLPNHYESILRDYQKFGFQWLHFMKENRFGAILADDMGLGKTLQVIALLESEKQEATSIVITPSSILLNWQDEITKFASELSCLCILGSATQREEMISRIGQYDIVITSYDYLRRDITLYENYHFNYIILDEAQYIKNQKTKNARTVKTLKGSHHLALSGTPIENSLAELWSIFDFLMPNYLFSYHYFLQHYEKLIVKDQDENAMKKLKAMVEPFILRRNKKDVLTELPDKIEHTLNIHFDDEEEKLYLANFAKVSQEFRKQLKLEQVDKMQVLAMLTKLRQLCCEPRLLYENIETPSSKLRACMELIMSLKENQQKILLFSSFTSVLDLIEKELYKNHISFMTLSGKNNKEERRTMVQNFQDKKFDVFLISLKAGGTGLNLTAAEAVIHYDPWWNVSAQNQASNRAYRMGQEKNVQVFKLIMKDSIEEKIQQLQEKKKNLADSFVEESDGSIRSMNTAQIMELFDLKNEL